MAPATCNPGRGPRPDDVPTWSVLGGEVLATIVGGMIAGWWLNHKFASPLVLLACGLATIAIALWRLLSGSRRS